MGLWSKICHKLLKPVFEEINQNKSEIDNNKREIENKTNALNDRFASNDTMMHSLLKTQKLTDKLVERFNNNDLTMQSLLETQKLTDKLVERSNNNDLTMQSLLETQKLTDKLVERFNNNDLTMQSLLETQKLTDKLVERFNNNDLTMQSLLETQKLTDKLVERFNNNDLTMQSLLETQKLTDKLVERFNNNDLTMQSLIDTQKHFDELNAFIGSLNFKNINDMIQNLAINVRNNNDIIKKISADQNVAKLESGYGFSMLNKITNSQSGEDCIMAHIAANLKIPFEKCNYIDLGANHPREMSNTYFFYSQGARGVLVEANSLLCRELMTERKEDVVLHKAVTGSSGDMVKFNVLNGDGLSTIGKIDDIIEVNPEIGLERIETVETICYNDIVEKYLHSAPVILNIDVEGLELEILHSVDFVDKRPVIIVVEMIPYSPKLVVGEKNNEIIEFMRSVNYIEYAFTGINSIFIDKGKLQTTSEDHNGSKHTRNNEESSSCGRS